MFIFYSGLSNRLLIALLFISFIQDEIFAQNKTDSTVTGKMEALRVFIDCENCAEELDFLKSEIKFINYVRDVKQAQLYLLITSQNTGSNGEAFTIFFFGQEEFAGYKDTLQYTVKQSATEDETRQGLLSLLKLGLIRYVLKTPEAHRLRVSYTGALDPVTVKGDKWNNWVFGLGGNGYFTGEKTSLSAYLSGWTQVKRVTEKWKLLADGSFNYSENKFKVFDDRDSLLALYVSYLRSRFGNILVVKSLTEHWSAGLRAGASASTFNNSRQLLYASPAIEYNIFPYSQSTRRQFRIGYSAGPRHHLYIDTTIYNKTEELLYVHYLTAEFSVKQKWGSAYLNLEAAHYFHDITKNHIRAWGGVNFRLFEGVSVNFSGNYSVIHDQLSLPKGEATEEELLLRQKQLATTYSYYFSVGFNYTFGSIYNNVVNPRFGN